MLSTSSHLRQNLTIPTERIAAFCRQWKITHLAIFGSSLRNDFRPDSDIDLLATFAAEAQWSLLHHVQMQDELKAIFGRNVDLISRRGIEQSTNYIRRKAILESAETIYVA
jgi:predicted nucleotidyltransferase